MEVGILMNSGKNGNRPHAAPAFTVALAGLTPNPAHGASAQGGVALSVTVSGFHGQTPPLTYQWRTTQGGAIAGAIGPSHTPDAAVHDLQTLYCAVSLQDGTTVNSPFATIRHAPPVLLAALGDEILDLGSGPQPVPLAGVFGGSGLSCQVSGAGVTYDAQTETLIVPTDTPVSGETVTVLALNSGGTATASFLLTVEAAAEGDMEVVVDPLTPRGANGIAVGSTTIISGDPAGHWDIVSGELTPSVAGDAADLDQGPYRLTLGTGAVIDIFVAPLPFAETQWALSGPRPDGFDLVIFDLPHDRGTPIAELQISVNGSPWTPLSDIQPGSYPISGLTPGTGCRVELRAVGGGDSATSVKGIATVPADPRGFRGWDPAINLGTGGDIYVAPYGNDAATGSETDPYATLTRALTAATIGQIIKLRAGTYRERVTAKAGVSIQGHGREKPRITAAEALTGLTQCSAADLAALGPALGIDGSPVYKTSLPKTALAYADPMALNLHEAGQRMFLATDRADTTDLFARRDQNTFYQADSFEVNASDRIVSITSSSVLDGHDAAQLSQARAMVYAAPNVSTLLNITGVDLPATRIEVDGDLKGARRQSANPADWLFALVNLAPAMTPGTFAVIDAGASLEIYVYPRDPANVALIEYSARTRIIEFPATGNGISVHGLHLSQATGENSGGGFSVYKGASSETTSGHRLSHILSTGADNVQDVARSMRFVRVDDTHVERSSFYDIIGRGIFFSSAGGVRGTGNKVERCHFERISGAGFYAYDQERHVEAHNLARDTGLDAHSNKSNHYAVGAGSHQLLFWGNEFENARGYVVWQNHSAPTAAFNWLPIKSDGAPWHRTLTDDNQNYNDIPVKGTQGFVFNNSVLPNLGLPSGGKGIDLARPNSDIAYRIDNNVAHGMNDAGDFAALVANASYHTALPLSVRSNIVTYLDNNQTGSDFDISNAIALILPQVYTDAAAGDFSPVPGSPLLSIPGQDMSAEVAMLAGIYTQFTGFDRDFKNQPIDWAARPVGADAGLAFSRVQAEQNLVPDPGFDDPANWFTVAGHAVTGGRLVIGAAAANFTSSGQNGAHRTPVSGGTTYRITCDVISVTTPGRLRLQTALYAAGAAQGTVTGFDGAVSGGTQISFELTPPAGVDELSIQFNKVVDVDAVFDNLSCIAVN